MNLLHVIIGNVQGGARTQWWYPVLLGAVYCPLYYVVFRAVIRRMHVETPGRESDEQTPPEQEKQSADERSQTIINGLRGRQNIADVDCCFTRLRVRVRDMRQVVDRTLMLTGASGVKRVSGNDVRVIYGPQVEKIAHDVKRTLGVSS